MVEPLGRMRMRWRARYQDLEHRLQGGVWKAIGAWLADLTRRLLGGRAQDLPAAGNAATAVWATAVDEHIAPVIRDAYTAGFGDVSDLDPTPFAVAHMRLVHDRLVDWPVGVFDDIRPELVDAIEGAESVEDATDRVGRITGLDAKSRRIRRELARIDIELAATNDPAVIARLTGRRAALVRAVGDADLEWRWRARRVAQTELTGALAAGAVEAARVREQLSGGGRLFKQWVSLDDGRTRPSHVVADGQIVPLSTRFTVGMAGRLLYPGDPFGPPHEVVGCRCHVRVLTWSDVQGLLQGQAGRLGAVGGGAARLGPDSPAAVFAAIDDLIS